MRGGRGRLRLSQHGASQRHCGERRNRHEQPLQSLGHRVPFVVVAKRHAGFQPEM
jgi:hypothetical protein